MDGRLLAAPMLGCVLIKPELTNAQKCSRLHDWCSVRPECAADTGFDAGSYSFEGADPCFVHTVHEQHLCKLNRDRMASWDAVASDFEGVDVNRVVRNGIDIMEREPDVWRARILILAAAYPDVNWPQVQSNLVIHEHARPCWCMQLGLLVHLAAILQVLCKQPLLQGACTRDACLTAACG